jgi:uncharacterized repeat protein (TIGR03803 family)
MFRLRSCKFFVLPSAVLALAFSCPATAFGQAREAGSSADVRPDVTYTFSLLDSFTGTSGAIQGSFPSYGSLVQASDGNFYGLALGGADGDGVVFKVTPAGAYTLLHTFTDSATDGSRPFGGLIQATDGNFYGVTQYGGANNQGTIFQITPGGAFAVIHSFAGTADGDQPLCTLTQGSDGSLYGTTAAGGTNGDGTIYKVTLGGAFTLLHTLAGSDGQAPIGGMVQGTNGLFYGVLPFGAGNGLGGVYTITADGDYNLLYSFVSTGTHDRQGAAAALIQGTDGNFYGTTYEGGTDNSGAVFKLTPGGAFTSLYSFTDGADGGTSYGGLVLATDGNFYGTTEIGGTGAGTLYQMTPGGTATPVFDFTTATGHNSQSAVVQGMDGNFYGLQFGGGADSDGTIFEVAVSPALAAPVQLSASATTVGEGASFTMSYAVLNAPTGTLPGTLNQCFATNNAGDTTGWAGILDATPTTATKSLTASTAPGSYTYSLTCGGVESSLVTLTVAAPNLTFTSVSHNFGQVAVGTAAAAYGIKVTNSGSAAYPFSLVFTPSKGFTSANNCGASIAVNASCQMAFYFTPTAAGAVSTTWSLAPETGVFYGPSNGGTLSGSGASASGGVSLTSGGHNFGTLAVGTTSPAYGTELSNSTSSAVTLNLGSVSAPFASITNCGTTLAAGSSCELEFTFKPVTTGAVQQVYALSANGVTITAGGQPLPNGGITLSGTGQ